MTDAISDRERGEERKYEKDQEKRFKVEARRNKLLGHWLAGEFGMGPAETEEYAKEVVIADLEEPGIEDLLRKVMADISGRGIDISDDQVREKIEELDVMAIKQLSEED
mgnify:CR=1 FL=1